MIDKRMAWMLRIVAAQTMLSQLERWTKGLKSIREDKDY